MAAHDDPDIRLPDPIIERMMREHARRIHEYNMAIMRDTFNPPSDWDLNASLERTRRRLQEMNAPLVEEHHIE